MQAVLRCEYRTTAIIEYPYFLVNNLVQVIGVEFICSSALFVHGHAHLFELLQNKFDALIHRHAMPDQAMQRLVDRIVLVVADAVRVPADSVSNSRTSDRPLSSGTTSLRA